MQGDGESGVDRGGVCLPEHCFTFATGDETGPNCGGSCQVVLRCVLQYVLQCVLQCVAVRLPEHYLTFAMGWLR